ncbi:hypothetical protein ACWFR1_39710 [Streptomyces sp. NPDC055103]
MLLSVVPLHAASRGGSGAAGLATGALMPATVGGGLATPQFVARFGYRRALATGLVLLGAPTLVLTASGSTMWITAVCVVRGMGFALTVVAGGTLTASLIPPERRGDGLAVVAIVSGSRPSPGVSVGAGGRLREFVWGRVGRWTWSGPDAGSGSPRSFSRGWAGTASQLAGRGSAARR